MDFFARQDRARTQTGQLIFLFVLSVAAVVIALTAVLSLILFVGADRSGAATGGVGWWVTHASWVGTIAFVVLAIIFVGAGMKSMQLQGGGSVVARSLGGDLVDASTRDPLRRRLVNVVEEMAIASGVPVPAVYVLDGEDGVNAFAAGHSPSDAAIAVTRGALERFDRDELQGVIGHEFSHLLNGDMRLNMRLIGMVGGLFAIAAVGRVMLRGGSRSRKGGAIALAGVAMLVLGGLGMLLGRMIQAAISRQREFLADASAVQFTRDPQGLRDALVKVGAAEGGSRLDSTRTDEIAHMLFASGLAGLFATHPPLDERIRALDPSFQPDEFARVAKTMPQLRAEVRAHAAEQSGLAAVTPPAGFPAVAAAAGAVAIGPVAPQVGTMRPVHVREAARRLAGVPDGVLAGAEDPTGAALTLWALLLGEGAAVGEGERALLASEYGEPLAAAASARHADLCVLAAEQRLPVLLRLLPVLGRLPETERERMLGVVQRLVRADGSITVSEYALARLAKVHLGQQLDPQSVSGRATLLQLEPELQRVLSVLARFGHTSAEVARDAYERGMTRALPGRRAPFLPDGDWVGPLDEALDRLDRLRLEDKSRLVDSLGIVVAHDRLLDLAEAELLRAICGSLHCPLPPFVDDGPVAAA